MSLPAESASPATPSPFPAELVLTAHAERLRESDLESFDEIYRLTRDEVARILFHLAGPRADLETLVGDVYVRLFERLRREPAKTVRPVLHRVCAQVALQRPGLFRRPALRALEADASPAAQAAWKLHLALARLPAKARVAFVFSEVLGLSIDETLAATGLSRGALESLLCRARLALTEALRPNEEAVEVTP